MIFTRKIALAGTLALAIVAPVAITGCDSGSPTATVVVSSTATTGTSVTKAPQAQPTAPDAVATTGPEPVATKPPAASQP